MQCFHCQDAIADDVIVRCTVDGIERAFCCLGCEAAALFIDGAGLGSFYQHREQSAEGLLRPEQDTFHTFDDAAIAAPFIRTSDGEQSVTLYLSDLYCPACIWLVTEILDDVPGVVDVAANPSTRRVHIRWTDTTTTLADLLRALARVGFDPQPVIAGQTSEREQQDLRNAMKRLVVAGVFGMQTMMLAIGLYLGEWQGMSEDTVSLLRIASLVTVLPVITYSALPFFRGAIRGLRLWKPGMDLPVSLALLIAFGASFLSTLLNGAAVYFDSIAMFVTLLSVSRFFELRARHEADDQAEALAALLPVAANRVRSDGRSEQVATGAIATEDLIAVSQGETIAADGQILSGAAQIDERLVTGESRAITRAAGERVLAGTRVITGDIVVRVTEVGAQTHLGDITRLMERAQTERGTLQSLADRLAAPFVVLVLAMALITGVGWYFVDAARIVPTVLAVLIVACPCALSLATPTALAATASVLARCKVLLTQARILDTFKPGAAVVFDKTGTLTLGTPRLAGVECLTSQRTEAELLAIAAALESDADHAIAGAFAEHASAAARADSPPLASVGAGVAGRVNGKTYRLGKASYVSALSQGHAPADEGIFLGSDEGLLARFELSDTLKQDAGDCVAELSRQGFAVIISSGDSASAVARVARELGVSQWHARQTPGDKLQLVAELKRNHAAVIMVGDGVNDAPVLSEADAAIAIGSGTALARASADAILLGDALTPLRDLLHYAQLSRKTIRRSLVWAASYNAAGVSLAAAGLVTPWMAAIGMTASSLLVVWNALRIGSRKQARTTEPAAKTLPSAAPTEVIA